MSDRPQAKGERGDAALDLAHLASQTLNKRALQREVLILFDEQAIRTLIAIKAAGAATGRREAAHALVGAARGIGAFAVARAAGVIESGEGDSPAGIAALEAAIGEARRAIAGHLSD
jgi:hypothetical protein